MVLLFDRKKCIETCLKNLRQASGGKRGQEGEIARLIDEVAGILHRCQVTKQVHLKKEECVGAYESAPEDKWPDNTGM